MLCSQDLVRQILSVQTPVLKALVYFNVLWKYLDFWIFFYTFCYYSLSTELVQTLSSHNKLIWKKSHLLELFSILREWCNAGNISRRKGGFGCCCYMIWAWSENVYLVDVCPLLHLPTVTHWVLPSPFQSVTSHLHCSLRSWVLHTALSEDCLCPQRRAAPMLWQWKVSHRSSLRSWWSCCQVSESSCGSWG